MAASFCSSGSGRWKYDVFLNFRGEDTRKIFVGHLYNVLEQKAIYTFIDAEELRKGNDLSELLKAIQESRVSIVVFSQNYASSTWCLKELVKILECADTEQQMVVPVFYQVDPSDVRKHKRSFAEAFAQHDHDSVADIGEVQSWRSALTRATNLSGWDSRNYSDDAKLVEEIVPDIFIKLNNTSSSQDNGLVGMDSHMHEMDLRLCPGIDAVRVVGIWGMGGLGKTTIARAVYDKVACQFEAVCFLENVKEGFSKNGAVRMQEQLLTRILKEKVPSLGTLDRGYKMIMERLASKRVLLVLDDVDDLAQIESLPGTGKQPSFGGGSRIIITTRDRHLLNGADAIYRPENLSESGALQLFRQYAFRTNQPTRDYDHLSRRVIQYARGLPLALKVLGAFLDNKSVCEWEDVLKKIRKIPHKGIQNVLKTSFDGLDESEKDIFLDIACFFKGMNKDCATKVLKGCGFYPHAGLKVLIDRALITVSSSCTLEMHDLLEEMGREIVRQESIKEAGERSRLWSYEDVHHVLTQNTATEAVESIILKFPVAEGVNLPTEAFVNMSRLRLLKISHEIWMLDGGVRLSCDDFKLSHELRCLIWYECTRKSLPSNFNPKNLVYLDMQYSDVEQLWEGTKPLEKLEIVNLSHSRYLKKTPDFTKATNLEELILDGCTSLIEVFPSSICMNSLKNLALSGCSNLEKFSEISEVMEKLVKLRLDRTAIKELPSSIKNLTGLRYLTLEDCRELESLPSSISMKSLETLILSGCSKFEKFSEISEVMEELLELHLDRTAIKELPSSFKNLTRLNCLTLEDCRELESLPSSICMQSLETLVLLGCSKLEKFSEISEVMEKLVKLRLDRTAIKELPSSIKNLTGLRYLTLEDCRELESLPSSICMKSLKTLVLSGCSKLEKFSETSEVMKKLFELNLDQTTIEELPSSIKNLPKLRDLTIKDCRKLDSLSKQDLST